MSGSPLRTTIAVILVVVAGHLHAQGQPVSPAPGPTLAGLLEAGEAAQADQSDDSAGDGGTSRDRYPVPPEAERSVARARVREIFNDDIQAAKSPEAKAAIAGKLMLYVDEASDRATHFVLLETARRLGIEACDIPLARDAARRLAEAYTVDPRILDDDALTAMSVEAPPAKLGAVIDALVEAGRGALPKDPARAEELATAAATAARRAKDRERATAIAQVLADVREAKKREARVKPLLQRLSQSPDDAEASLELGMIRCFDEQNWNEGLRYLSTGSDRTLAMVARRDRAAQADPGRLVAAADAWWDYGKSEKGSVAAAALQRARFHYGAAIENARGLDRARIEKRLADLDGDLAAKRPSSAWSPRKFAGLTWWLDASDPASVKLSGQVVNLWVDKAGGGRSFAQADAQKRPAYRGLINGRRTIAFDGVDDVLEFTSPNEALCDASGAALFIVFKPDGDGEFSLYGQTNNSGRDRSMDAKTYHGYFRQSRMDGIPGVLSATEVTLLASRTQAAGSQTLRINGQVAQSQTSVFTAWRSSAGEAVADVKKVHTIGVNPIPADYFKGQIAEVIMFGRQLGDPEVAAVERYLKAKWGTP